MVYGTDRIGACTGSRAGISKRPRAQGFYIDVCHWRLFSFGSSIRNTLKKEYLFVFSSNKINEYEIRFQRLIPAYVVINGLNMQQKPSIPVVITKEDIMKYTITFLSFLFITSLLGQMPQEPATRILENNHRIMNSAAYGPLSHYEETEVVLQDRRDTLIRSFQLITPLFSAIDRNGDIKLTTEFYGTSGFYFLPGPLSRDGGLEPMDPDGNYFNKVWEVRRDQIQELIYLREEGLLTADRIPEDILSWPARGNPFFEMAEIDFDLAPFLDFDSDGIYDPLSGDLPLCLEENPDYFPRQWHFSVMNDVNDRMSAIYLGLEIKQISWVDECSVDTVGNWSVFHRLEYEIMDDAGLSDIRFGIFEDTDLGVTIPYQQFGCWPDMNVSFSYQKGFSNEFPLIMEVSQHLIENEHFAIKSTKWLNRDLYAHMLTRFSEVPDQNFMSNAFWYHQYLNGKWPDGFPIAAYGNGYDPQSSDTTRYMFSDLPNDPNGWSMERLTNAGANAQVSSIDLGDTQRGKIDFVDHFYLKATEDGVNTFDDYPNLMMELQSIYDSMIDGSYECGELEPLCFDQDCVWPGDVNRNGKVQADDWVWYNLHEVSGYSGISRSIRSNTWTSYNADDWGDSWNDLDAKHADIDGNGQLESDDALDLLDNFDQKTPAYTGEDVLIDYFNAQGLSIQVSNGIMDADNSFPPNKANELTVSLGDEQGQIEHELYGLSFQLKFDSNYFAFVPDNLFGEISYATFSLNHIEFMDAGTNRFNQLLGDNRVFLMFGQDNLEDLSTAGDYLAKFSLFIRDELVTNNPDGRDTMYFEVYNLQGINSAGETFDIGIRHLDSIVIKNMIYDPTVNQTEVLEDQKEPLIAFPNPILQGVLQFNRMISGTLFDAWGSIVRQLSHQKSVDISDLPRGLYFLRSKNYGNVKVVKY